MPFCVQGVQHVPSQVAASPEAREALLAVRPGALAQLARAAGGASASLCASSLGASWHGVKVMHCGAFQSWALHSVQLTGSGPMALSHQARCTHWWPAPTAATAQSALYVTWTGRRCLIPCTCSRFATQHRHRHVLRAMLGRAWKV